MALILSIVGYKNQPAAQPRTQRFTEAEVTLGRGTQNSCVLPDPENVVSKTHCIIRRQGGGYELADSSSNGTFLNFSHEPLGRDRTAVLKDGDRLAVGDYDILVQLAPEPEAAQGARPAAAPAPFFPDPFGTPAPFAAPAPDPFGAQAPDPFGAHAPDPFGAHAPDPFGVPAPDPFGAGPAASPMPSAPDPFGLQNLLGTPGPAPLGEGFGAPPVADLDALFQPVGNPGGLVRSPEAEPQWPPAGAQNIAPWVTQPDHTPPEQASFRAPSLTPPDPAPPEPASFHAPSAAPPAIPEDWDPLALLDPAAKAPAPVRTPAPPPAMLPPEPPTPPAPPELVERPAPPPRALPPDDAFGIGLLQGAPAPQAAPEPPPSARPAVAPPAASADDSALLHAFLEAAGLPATAAEGESQLDTMRHVGQLLREMVGGLSEVLAARTMIKGEYRLDRTQIGAANNNPLKMTPTVEGALTLLIGPTRPGYMPGVRAVKEGFRDIKAHELALVAGMQAAVSALLRQFDPEQLKGRLDKHSLLGSLLPATRKAKYWEVYEQQYRQIAGDVSEDVSGVFGRAFARAYEEQIEKLSS